MSEMIEIVAVALHQGDDPWTPWAELPDEDTSYGVGKARRRQQAKIAIERMRKPPAEMIRWGTAMMAAVDMTRTETGERREMDEWFEDEAELQLAFSMGWRAAVQFALGELPDWSKDATEDPPSPC